MQALLVRGLLCHIRRRNQEEEEADVNPAVKNRIRYHRLSGRDRIVSQVAEGASHRDQLDR